MKKNNMIKIVIMIVAFIFSATINAQSYIREGTLFIFSTGERDSTLNTIETNFTVKDTDNKIYKVYCSKRTGSCFIKRISRKGKEYRKYLGAEISRKICIELNIEYKPRNDSNNNI